ncbi:MAG: tRNA preQ1(34) S-adenosylmethionine ribosyltransferase-isomerase QueA [Legionellales bacterium]|jgi:S-adenosylmethionine:tRNA ribosyltransferase-isomerase|nr:tRNA preQ1(34) S-adenosylmethionine ribosyltransferase-isomerase QueA [Legionellales bacterium]
MQLNDFDYNLPAELIATAPMPNRSASKLLQLNTKHKTIKHGAFTDILQLLEPGDMLVLNNTKVIPARIYAQKQTGGNVTILIEEIINANTATAMIKTNHKLQLPACLTIKNTNINVNVTAKNGNTYNITTTKAITSILEQHGHIPLPPYMQRMDNESDKERYQTVYASEPGAIAAPTAGLHFDQELLDKIKAKGVNVAYITLHVGSGTFQSIKEQDLSKHKMHHEYIDISPEVAQLWQTTKKNGKRVIAVGTTSIRSLESAWDGTKVIATSGKTNLFITPGYKFNTIDALITNFHLPKSTLLMLTCALAGYDLTMNAYKIAVTEKYRFFSYGDAMFIT